MFCFVERVDCLIVRVARRVGKADLREGMSGLSGVICS